MKKILAVMALIVTPLYNSALAEEYFFENGFYVSLGANANHIDRQKRITFGAVGVPGVTFPISPPESDWAAAPTVGVGYKFDDMNSVIVRGDWARYSTDRSISSPTTQFAFTAVNIGTGTGVVQAAPSTARVDWESDVYNLELEYKRKLWSDPLGGILGILGVRYRHESQDFEGKHRGGAGLTPMNVDLDEDLKEHLFGPFAGIGVSFKPAQDSRLGINISTKIGYFFKDADLRARDVMLTEFGLSRHALNDDSSNGSFFSNVALGLMYSLNRNWSLSGAYRFDFIDRAAHISNNTVFPARPTKLENSSISTQSVGLKILYKF